MTESKEHEPARGELLAALAEEARGAAGGPVEAEELVAYLEGNLEPEDQRRIHQRILGDPETARQLLDLDELLAAETGRLSSARGVADFATEAGWRDLEGRLAAEEAGPQEEARSPRRAANLRLWQSAAAVGLVVASVLGIRLGTLAPRAASTLADAQPAVSLDLVADLRGPGAPPVVTVPEGARLHLEIAPTERCAEYEVEIDSPQAAGTRLPLTPNERGSLVLGLAGDPGDYRLSLTGCDPPREIEQHRFRVAQP
ncbi:MAG: hypothetical protein AAF481_09870 [Acidobacteriota bacterium]